MASKYTIPCKAIVTYSPQEWKLEDVLLREPEENELLVRTVGMSGAHDIECSQLRLK